MKKTYSSRGALVLNPVTDDIITTILSGDILYERYGPPELVTMTVFIEKHLGWDHEWPEEVKDILNQRGSNEEEYIEVWQNLYMEVAEELLRRRDLGIVTHTPYNDMLS